MKKSLGLSFLFFLIVSSASAFATETETISEMLGYQIKDEIDKCNYDIDINKVIEGITRARKGEKPPLSKDEYNILISRIIQQNIAETERDNLCLANDFFQKNKGKKNVVEIVEQKLQYEVLSEGNGEKVDHHNTPVISIKGFLPDNRVFLSEYEFVTSLNDLPQGLKLAILGMKEKEKRKIYIHPDYTHNIFDSPSPRSFLIYEVELLKNDKSKINSVNNNLAEESGKIR